MLTGYILIGILVAFFIYVSFSGKKMKEYAVYLADGKIKRRYRRQQDKWREGFGQMIFYRKSKKDPNKYLRSNIGNHWYIEISELEEGEWDEIEKQQKESGK
jgi:hypothetical protein